MLALGWVLCEDGDTLTLPRPKNTTMAEVREVQAAQDILRKAAARRKPASSTLPVDAEQVLSCQAELMLVYQQCIHWADNTAA